MLAIGTPELVVVFLVVLMVLGPKKFLELIGSIGKGIRQFRRSLHANDEPEMLPCDLDTWQSILMAVTGWMNRL